MHVPKYQPLTDYLMKCGEDTLTMTFSEIENVLGFELPYSAYNYPVWWTNSNQITSLYWLRAGYIVTQYSMSARFAVFHKDRVSADSYLARIPKKVDSSKSRAGLNSCKPVNSPIRITCCSCSQLISASKKYYDEIMRDPHARYLSWEHCYSFFQNNRVNPREETLDLMCLHLAWYLASWGMLRGGSFLLWKDYKVHLPVVKLLVSEEYEDLNTCSAEYLCNAQAVNKIMELSTKIDSIYWQITSETGAGRHASDTLVTKILLGTLGCVPAYDRFFKSGLSISNVAQQHYGKASLMQLANYYVANEEKLESFRNQISAGKVDYTPMKIIDMCFWQLGIDNSSESEKEDI